GFGGASGSTIFFVVFARDDFFGASSSSRGASSCPELRSTARRERGLSPRDAGSFFFALVFAVERFVDIRLPRLLLHSPAPRAGCDHWVSSDPGTQSHSRDRSERPYEGPLRLCSSSAYPIRACKAQTRVRVGGSIAGSNCVI